MSNRDEPYTRYTPETRGWDGSVPNDGCGPWTGTESDTRGPTLGGIPGLTDGEADAYLEAMGFGDG